MPRPQWLWEAVLKLMYTCKEVSRLLSDSQDGELPASERARLRLHLVMCDTCHHIEKRFNFLRQAMQRLSQGEPPAS